MKAFTVGSTLLISIGCLADETALLQEAVPVQETVLAQETEISSDELQKPGKDIGITYTVTPDTRRCAFPACGGWYLTPVNQYSSQLEDENESFQKSLLAPNSIYVSNINYKGLRLKPRQIQDFEGYLRSGQGLLAGDVVSRSLPHKQKTNVLNARAVWTSPTNTNPIGPYLKVVSSGIVCITTPCPYFTAKLINNTYSVNYHDLSFERDELNNGDEALAWQAVSTTGLVVTGVRYFPEGQTGTGTGISATKVFFAYPDKKLNRSTQSVDPVLQ